jgi:hypothetical protein
MGRGPVLLRLAGSRFGAGKDALRSDQELNVVQFVNFWGIHGGWMYHIHAQRAPTA